jgi:hypothetical protein
VHKGIQFPLEKICKYTSIYIYILIVFHELRQKNVNHVSTKICDKVQEVIKKGKKVKGLCHRSFSGKYESTDNRHI